MDKNKADALVNAVIAGKIEKVRELLAAGAAVEATDVNRMTPVMLAAQGGHVEVFQMLVQAGANLRALAFRQVDVLEMAARGGNVEIIRFLLKAGLPVNGHWQPTVPALLKTGHDTPLIQAAVHGEVEAVRVLLEAGADQDAKHNGKTALQQVKENLRDPAFAELRHELRAVAALLGDVPTINTRSTDAELREVKKFAANARRPEFVEFRKSLVERCGGSKTWKPLPDHGLPAEEVVAMTLARCAKQKVLEGLQAEARKAGGQLILAGPWELGEDAHLVLFPTDNKLAVVAAVGTEGTNYGVRTTDVIAWLEGVDQENPFHLVFCNHELVGGAFVGPAKAVKELAERMADFCPPCLDEGFDEVKELAAAVKQRKSFLLRWD